MKFLKRLHRSIKHEKRHVRLDWMVALTLLVLLILSCMMVYSASMIGNKYGTFTSGIPVGETYFLQRQASWAILAYIAFLTFSVVIPFEVFKNKQLLKTGFIIMVILLIIPQLMPAINGAKSWIRIGGFSFQPSTLAQLFIIIYMAFILETRKEKLDIICAKIQHDIWKKTGVYSTVGMSNANPLLAKLALDNEAKKTPTMRANWSYEDVETKVWNIPTLTDFWGIGNRTEKRLNKLK